MNKSVRNAFTKSKISKDLQKEFLKFLTDYPDYGEQANYLLNTKKQSIESVVYDLFNVQLKDQFNWKKTKLKKTFEDHELEYRLLDSIPEDTVSPKILFKEWKQEHGLDSPPLEVGDSHTIINISKYTTSNLEVNFKWEFIKSRYGKRGWGSKKKIKSILKSILDNNSNPGWIVLSFLEGKKNSSNKLENSKNKELANPFILNNHDSHILTRLVLGHPYFFKEDNKKPIYSSNKILELKLIKVDFEGYFLVFGVLYSNEDEKVNIDINDLYKNEIYFKGNYPAIIVNNIYYSIRKDHHFPCKMVYESLYGIIIEKTDQINFLKEWNQLFPKINIIPKSKFYYPDFNIKNYCDWRSWIRIAQEEKDKFKENIWPQVYLQSDPYKGYNNKLIFSIKKNSENIDLLSQKYPNMNILKTIKNSLLQNEKNSFVLNRIQASNFLELTENYPYLYNDKGDPLISHTKLEFSLTIKKNPQNRSQYLLIGVISNKSGKNEKEISWENSQIFGLVPSYTLYNNQIVKVSNMLSSRMINDTLIGVIINESDLNEFYSSTLPIIKQRQISINDPQGLLKVSALYNYKLEGNMLIWEEDGKLIGHLECVMVTDIGRYPYQLDLYGDDFYQKLDGKKYLISRNINQENQLFEKLYLDGWVDIENGDYTMNDKNAIKFVLDILPNNKNKENKSIIVYRGYKNLKKWKVEKIVPTIDTKIKSNINWFDLNVEIKCSGQNIEIDKIIEMWLSRSKFINLPNKYGIALIDEKWIDKNAPILYRLLESKKEGHKSTNNEIRFEHYNIGLINYLQEISNTTKYDNKWKNLKNKLLDTKPTPDIELPSYFTTKLRPYQKIGVSWLCFLRKYGFCGILADDMGLGKTIQALAFLTIDRQKGNKKPVLVISPSLVTNNWIDEINKFTPFFKYIHFQGSNRHKYFKNIKETDILVTSYNLLQRDIEKLKKHKYSVIILDEAQMIKNFRSKNAQTVNKLQSEFRLSLTGTPIENSISELWSQFNFLMPDFINYKKKPFINRNIIKPQRNKDKLIVLKRQTKPFILRRMKQTVATELPEKTEQVLYCEMQEDQRNLYNSVLEYIQKQLKDKINNKEIQKNRYTIFEWMLRLRQICCDPRLSNISLIDPPRSAKLELFIITLEEIVKEGHRVLVFSQFVKMLNLISNLLDEKKIPYLQLDGSVNYRNDIIKRFQSNHDFSVFLISLKAGGTGINLTSADYVIHFDPWWNPAAEAQATDRAHRIGQKNKVHVYKLITKNSIEEKIQLLQEKKKRLYNEVININHPNDDLFDINFISKIFEL